MCILRIEGATLAANVTVRDEGGCAEQTNKTAPGAHLQLVRYEYQLGCDIGAPGKRRFDR